MEDKDNKDTGKNDFVMKNLLGLVHDIASLNSEVNQSFKSFQDSLANIEKVIAIIQTKSHTQEHELIKLTSNLKMLRDNYVQVREKTNQRICDIETKLKTYIHKPNWKKISAIIITIAAVLTAILTIIKFWNDIKAVFGI